MKHKLTLLKVGVPTITPALSIAMHNTAKREMSRDEKRRYKQVDPFYKTKAWAAAREEAIGLAFGFCAHCGCNPERKFVDHIVERNDGGEPYAQHNLQVLCGSCHTIKTNRAKYARAGGWGGAEYTAAVSTPQLEGDDYGDQES